MIMHQLAGINSVAYHIRVFKSALPAYI
jgi:hypothetical protein